MTSDANLPDDPDGYGDDEPSPEELAQMRQATTSDAAAVDQLILSLCTVRWQKVAMVIGSSLDEYDKRFASLPYVYMQVRMLELIERGVLEAQGDVMSMRTSQVRLPLAKNAA